MLYTAKAAFFPFINRDLSGDMAQLFMVLLHQSAQSWHISRDHEGVSL